MKFIQILGTSYFTTDILEEGIKLNIAINLSKVKPFGSTLQAANTSFLYDVT